MTNDSKQARETIVLAPGVHTFQTPDWCVAYHVHLKGGDAGTEDQAGEPGYAIIEMYDEPIGEA